MSHGGGKPRKKKRILSPQQREDTKPHHGDVSEQKDVSKNPLPIPSITIKEKNADNRASETDNVPKRILGMTIFECLMALLTLAGLFVAAFTGAILLRQTYAMITDQRPWIVMTGGPITYPRNPNGLPTLTMHMAISNIGKTPASKISTSVVVSIVRNGESPSFRYAYVPRSTDSTGIIFPNTPYPLDVYLLQKIKDKPDKGEIRYLSNPEFEQLTKGETYVAIYGLALYDDAYGVHRWTRYCTFAALTPSHIDVTGAQACTDYNAADNNQPRLFPALRETLFNRVFQPGAEEDTR